MALPAAAVASTWDEGDVFAAVGSDSYKVYDNTGAFEETISLGTGGLFTTGCAFDSSNDFYGTNFSASKVVKLDDAHPHPILQTINTATTGALDNESIVFAANGDFYVGNPDGNDDMLRYNAAGVYQQSYDVAVEDRGSDWLDLAADQKTMFYTSEGQQVKRYDVSGAGAQLADFAVGLPGSHAYALRLLPPGDGTGGLLVADSQQIVRLDGSGSVVQTYDQPGHDAWFALNLDPNGTSFWSGDFSTGNFFRLNIATGAVEVGPIAAGGSHFGLCVSGELTAGVPNEPDASIDDVTVTEGDSGTTDADFTVSLSAASGDDVTIAYSTADDTATDPDDYLAQAGTLTIPAGETEGTITVPVVGDVVNEPDETFFVNLGDAVGATVTDDQGVGTILDDDRNGIFSCRAQALRGGQGGSQVANPGDRECADDHVASPSLVLGGVSAFVLDAETDLGPNDQTLDPAPGDHGRAESSVAKLVIGSGANALRIHGIKSRAVAKCRIDGQGNFGPAVSARSSVATVIHNGQQTDVGDGHLDIDLGGLGVLHLNHTLKFQNEQRTEIIRRAVWLDRPNGGDLIAGEAEADYHGNPCETEGLL